MVEYYVHNLILALKQGDITASHDLEIIVVR